MKILSKTIKVNEETFTPEMVITLSVPLQLAEEKDDGCRKFCDELQKAIEEYNEKN